MSTASELENILDAQPEPTTQEIASKEPAQSQEGAKDTSTAPPAATATNPEPEHVPRAALMDERRKRQDVEKRLAEIEKRFQQQPQAAPQVPDLYANPEEYAAVLREQIAEENFAVRLELTEEVMSDKHPDYAEKRDTFIEAARNDPALVDKLRRSTNPAKFAYEQGKKIAFEREIGNNPEAYKAKLRAELMKEFGIDPAAQGQAPQKAQTAPLPKSLATIPSASNRAPNGQFRSNGPTPISDIIG